MYVYGSYSVAMCSPSNGDVNVGWSSGSWADDYYAGVTDWCSGGDDVSSSVSSCRMYASSDDSYVPDD